MRRVNLYGVDTEPRCPPGRVYKRLTNAHETRGVERHRRRFARLVGYGGGRAGYPTTLGQWNLLATFQGT